MQETILKFDDPIERFLWATGWFTVCIAFLACLFIFIAPVHAEPIINPSVEQQPFLCQNSLTRWICDMQKAAPAVPLGNYAYLPGRDGGQILIGGTQANDDLILNGTSSATKTSSYVLIQPDGGTAGIGTFAPLNASLVITRQDDSLAHIEMIQKEGSGGSYAFYSYDNGYFAFRDLPKNRNRLILSPAGNVSVGPYIYPTAAFQVLGTIRFESLGAGTMMTDASGNIYVISDKKLKTDIKPFSINAIEAIKKIVPITHKFTKESGLDTINTYTGLSADNVENAIPSAVFTKQDTKKVEIGKDIAIDVPIEGSYTKSISDRAIIATLILGIQEQQAQLDAQNQRIKALEEKLDKAGIK